MTNWSFQTQPHLVAPKSIAKFLPIVVFLAGTIGCHESKSPELNSAGQAVSSASIPNASAKFVGSQSCRECHKEIAESYNAHPMAKSLMRVSAATLAENYSDCEFSSVSNTSYLVEKIGDQVWHHEVRRNVNGDLIYDQKVPIHYAVGSGTRGRSYLTDVDGRLFQSPITWYTEGHKWDLSPGFVPGAHARFDRRVNHACLSCHAGASNLHNTDPDRFASPPFAEEAIGCERCHGPGSEHLEYQKKKPELRTSPDPIVNPENLSPHLQDAVCNQCHLQGQRRVLNPGRTEFDFRPGMNLSDVWTTILKTKGVQSGVANAVSQVEQMHASSCFQRSGGAMVCTSCHDPHSYPPAEQRASFYQAACLKCHHSGTTNCSELPASRELQKDSCVTCHMPRFGAADVHSSQTDHRILRRPKPAEPEEPEESAPVQRGDQLRFFAEPGVAPQVPEVERAGGIFMAETGDLHQNATASRQAVKTLTPNRVQDSVDVESLLALGRAYQQLGRRKDAEETLIRVTELSPQNEEAYELLATSCHEANQLSRARQYYEKLIVLNPKRARYHGRYAHVLGQLGNQRASVEAGEKALELDPSLIQTHEWLVQMYRLLGDVPNADRHQRKLDLFRAASGNRSDSKHRTEP